jgi:cell division protein FtsI/penicillin-binding protein 2
VLRLGVDKTRVDAAAQPEAARQVAELLGLDPGPYAERVAAAGERAFVEALVVRTENPGVDLVAFAAIPGALSVADTIQLSPSRRFARPILGAAGPATAEIIEASDGAVVAGETAGLSGLQLQYDAQLRGRPGLAVVVLREDTGDERELFRLDPVPGEPLVTTLDPRFQDAAESLLEPVGPASAIVAIRASTGEVLAAASGPGGEGYSTATLGTYAPGSSFKVVGSLALLRAGLTPDSPVECPASITVDGRVFNNFPDYPPGSLGTIPLRTAVAQSCNTAFIGSGDLVSQQALVDAAATLGLGVELRLGFPAFLGSVPVDSTGTDHAASMIGQGRIQVSPLAMATVAASVAGGRTVVPWLVGSAPPEAAAPATPLTSAEADALRALMRGVVTDGGARFLLDVPGPEVLAKTGTAQTGSGADLHNHVWMIAVQGDLAVAVFVETGEYGSATAGPLLEQFLAATAGMV